MAQPSSGSAGVFGPPRAVQQRLIQDVLSPWVGGSGDEALPLLLTLSSGVKGFTTIHAGSARQALTRLRFICQLADTSNELPMSALSALVSEAVDIVVHCVRSSGEVRVSEVVAVEESQAGPEAMQFTVTELFRRPRVDEPLAWTGNLPVRAARSLEEAGYDVRGLLDDRAVARPVSRPAPAPRTTGTTRKAAKVRAVKAVPRPDNGGAG